MEACEDSRSTALELTLHSPGQILRRSASNQICWKLFCWHILLFNLGIIFVTLQMILPS
jgi:hypothetical protein